VGAEAGFVEQAAAAGDAVAKVDVGFAQLESERDFAHGAVNAKGEVIEIGVEEEVSGGDGVGHFIDETDTDEAAVGPVSHFAAACVGEAELAAVTFFVEGVLLPAA